jgi:hypothetical protein
VHNPINRVQPELAITFLDSVLSDLDSLILFTGVHPNLLWIPALSQMFSEGGAKSIEVTTLSVDLSTHIVTGNASQ